MKDKNLSYMTNANLKPKKHFLCSRSVAKESFTSYLWSEVDVWYCERLYINVIFILKKIFWNNLLEKKCEKKDLTTEMYLSYEKGFIKVKLCGMA